MIRGTPLVHNAIHALSLIVIHAVPPAQSSFYFLDDLITCVIICLMYEIYVYANAQLSCFLSIGIFSNVVWVVNHNQRFLENYTHNVSLHTNPIKMPANGRLI